ncbi:translation initiation factor IF-2 subunit alpha [Halolamina sp. CBA1230]|uniref:translation initiation factor IF-2 subunit alpha n=1 Tax=Halolamina sp. CBA1230 TaxID=1853690 RepID=UPI0009A19D52|nr:translation initiation factor IF-2 subunit alpha [Halolamina sp. CBA1230]QKY21631.1 translation initiation factor IF-2 subunit alpha [Halolamina sp. CBA1230]
MAGNEWPEPGELVVGTVDEIADFGVFVDMEGYEHRGLVHISEVASGWIKNVRDHVSVGRTVVAKVLEVDESAQQVDLSLKDVNEHQRKQTIQEWKNQQKADKWMELAFGEDHDRDDVVETLTAEYDSLYEAFEEAAIHGMEALDGVGLDDEATQAVVQTARENVSVPYVNVTGYVDIRSPGPDGVDDVKAALRAAAGDGDHDVPEEVELEVSYVGAPEYRIEVQAPDYKTAEAELEAAAARAKTEVEEHGGTAEYHRERNEDDE